MKRTLVATAAASLIAAPALAADLPFEPPVIFEPAPVILNWTGVYIGLQGGYGFDAGDHGPIFPKVNGFIGGGHVGYNHQFNNFVLGVEGDIEYSGMSPNKRAVDVFNDGQAFRLGREYDWLASVRVRAGFAWDRWLLYATGGWAYANADFDTDGLLVSGADDNLHGWTVGGGVEALLTQRFSAGLEYRYTDLEDSNLVLRQVPAGPAVATELPNNFHAIRARVSYHF